MSQDGRVVAEKYRLISTQVGTSCCEQFGVAAAGRAWNRLNKLRYGIVDVQPLASTDRAARLSMSATHRPLLAAAAMAWGREKDAAARQPSPAPWPRPTTLTVSLRAEKLCDSTWL